MQQGEYVYATNGQIIIRCLKEGDYPQKSVKYDLAKVFDLEDFCQKKIAMKAIYAPAQVFEYQYCGKCNGTGTCEEYFFYKNRHFAIKAECPVCDGSGEADDFERTFYFVKFSESYVLYEHISKVIKLNLPTILVYHDWNRVKFVVGNKYEVVILTQKYDSSKDVIIHEFN